jgi:antitoxin component YwqK of YwqJK toxin-antitoxin module
MKTVRTVVLIIMVLGTSLTAVCQKPAEKTKLKSIIVTEEKQDMIVKKQFTESETYYDVKGNVIEEITYKQGKINKHFKYYYDSNDNKIKEEEFDSSGKITGTSEYKIENGLRTEKTVFDGNKKIKSKKFYKYTTY